MIKTILRLLKWVNVGTESSKVRHATPPAVRQQYHYHLGQCSIYPTTREGLKRRKQESLERSLQQEKERRQRAFAYTIDDGLPEQPITEPLDIKSIKRTDYQIALVRKGKYQE
jgi:hypothetical protein